MTVAPLIAMKSTKCESLEAVGKELDRRAHTYANDVDQSGRVSRLTATMMGRRFDSVY